MSNIRDDITQNARCGQARTADGKPCQAWRVRGQDACAGHLGLGIGQDMERARERSAATRSGDAEARRENRRKSFQDHAADALQAKAESLIAVYLDAAGGGDWRAAEALATRVLGRPTERVEVNESRGIDELTAEERAELRKQVQAAYPHLRVA